ncbi:MAG: hypothetical protein WCM76_15125 [Bacteroidota bacterium]
MTFIDEQTINSAIEKLHSTPQDDLPELFTGIGDSQPALLGYLMDYSDTFDDMDSKNSLIYMFAIIVLSFEMRGITVPVTPEEIEAEQEKQMNDLAGLEGKTDAELEELVHAITFSQPVLFDFIKDQLLSQAEETGVEDEQKMASTFAVLKLVVDVMTNTFNSRVPGMN